MDQLDQDLLDLRQVSFQVEEYIANQMFLLDYDPDEITPSLLLTLAYQMVIEELADLGIVFWDKDNSILSDWYLAKGVYHFRKFFDKDNLFLFLKRHRSILPSLESIITSEESDDSDILLILEELESIFPEHEDILVCTDHLAAVCSNDRLTEHLTAIIDRIKEIPESTIDDVASTAQYLVSLEKGRQAVVAAIDCIFERWTNLNKDVIAPWLANYDLDKAAANVVQIYAKVDRLDVSNYPTIHSFPM